MISIMTIFIIISTHDLARRSTKNPNEQPQNQRNFNSRPRKEVDPLQTIVRPWYLVFQLTTSQGGRRNYKERNFKEDYFNSRPRKEVDGLARESNLREEGYFNSRPRKEVDSNFYAKSFPFKITFCAHCI